MKYAVNGNIFRPAEEQTYIYFVDFLDECFGKYIISSFEPITTGKNHYSLGNTPTLVARVHYQVHLHGYATELFQFLAHVQLP